MKAMWDVFRMALVYVIVGGGSAALVVGAVRLWDWITGKRLGRRPVSDKLLRSPGEHLRSQIKRVEEKIGNWAGFVAAIPTLVASQLVVAYQTGSKVNYLSVAPAVVLLLAFLVVAIKRLIVLRAEWRDLDLGFSGERAVGEELNQLMFQGYYVFHDVPFGENRTKKFNIDHVLVGPTGVYALETKTRRKRKGRKGAKDHEVIFTGNTLRFPDYESADDLEQARWNAQSLAQFLTSATGERVNAAPVLLYPGWYVSRQGQGDVTVLSPREIRSFLSPIGGQDAPERLSPQQVRQIAHQLEQKCRDVEF